MIPCTFVTAVAGVLALPGAAQVCPAPLPVPGLSVAPNSITDVCCWSDPTVGDEETLFATAVSKFRRASDRSAVCLWTAAMVLVER